MALAEHVPASLTPLLRARVAALVAHFEQVQATRMVGVPLLNAALRVEAVGFQAAPAQAGLDAIEGAFWIEGVLITPWFMSLVRLPAQVQAHGHRVGTQQVRHFGAERFDFLSAHDPALGYHETCALFSPMDGFANQPQARDTALAALALIREGPAPVQPAHQPERPHQPGAAPHQALPPASAQPTRRAFFQRLAANPRGAA